MLYIVVPYCIILKFIYIPLPLAPHPWHPEFVTWSWQHLLWLPQLHQLHLTHRSVAFINSQSAPKIWPGNPASFSHLTKSTACCSSCWKQLANWMDGATNLCQDTLRECFSMELSAWIPKIRPSRTCAVNSSSSGHRSRLYPAWTRYLLRTIASAHVSSRTFTKHGKLRTLQILHTLLVPQEGSDLLWVHFSPEH